MNDDIETLYNELYNLYGDINKLYKLNDNFNNKCEYFENEIEDLKRENKSSNNYISFIIAASVFIALFVSAICCGISCSDRVKVEETPTEMRINLDNPQNKDIQLDINHG